MKRIVTLVAMLLVLAMLPLALFGCDDTADKTTTTSKTTATKADNEEEKDVLPGTEYKIKDNLDKIKINGRYSLSGRGIFCDNLGSGIEFQGTMKGKVYLSIGMVVTASNSNGMYLTVYVDGKRQEERFKTNMGKNGTVLTIADFGETSGEHHIRVVKQTEARYARGAMESITIDGTLGAKPADREYYIEFIGSDLICGMGNYNGTPDQEPSIAQTAQYEDGTASVSFIVAESLHADVSILGLSGMGVAGSWFKDTSGEPITAPKYYEANSYYRDKNTAYDFKNGRTPDLIVLNIGKNDNNIPVDQRPTDEVFRQTMKDFIEFLKETHGDDLKIIWTYDITEANPEKELEANDCRYTIAQEVLEELGGEEAGLYIYQIYTNRLGGQEHTDAAGHVQAASGLLDFIREKGILPVGQ